LALGTTGRDKPIERTVASNFDAPEKASRVSITDTPQQKKLHFRRQRIAGSGKRLRLALIRLEADATA
jgi:hypothetical protein